VTTLYHGDCLKIMPTIPNGSVDMVMTSPPYDNLRDYGKDFIGWGEHIWKPCLQHITRVLKDGGVCVWVVGDATIKGSETCTSFRQALYAKDECGLRLHDTMIYAKNNPLPQNHNRYEQQFEYMFIFSKNKPNIFNPIKIPTKNPNKQYSWTNANDYGTKSAKRKRNEISTTKKDKNKFNIWFFNVANKKETNSAPFPEQLAQDHISSWSNKGDIVLDPFMGSGTTGVACKNLNRDFIGIELDKGYFEIAKKRIEITKPEPQLFEVK